MTLFPKLMQETPPGVPTNKILVIVLSGFDGYSVVAMYEIPPGRREWREWWGIIRDRHPQDLFEIRRSYDPPY